MADQRAEDEPGVEVMKLGVGGVNLVKNPLKLDDNEIVRAQNAEPYRERGVAGVRKRAGWVQLTGIAQDPLRGTVALDFTASGNGDDLTGFDGTNIYGAIYLALTSTSWKVSVDGGTVWTTVTLTNTNTLAPRFTV